MNIADLARSVQAIAHNGLLFSKDQLPPLSTPRVTAGQIERLFMHHRDRALPTDFD